MSDETKTTNLPNRGDIMRRFTIYAEDPRIQPNRLTRRDLAVVRRYIIYLAAALDEDQQRAALDKTDEWLAMMDNLGEWEDR